MRLGEQAFGLHERPSPIKVGWADDAKTVVRYDFDGLWTWADMMAAIAQVNVMLASVPHRVDVIINMENSQTTPVSGVLVRLRNETMKAPPNWGMGVFVGINGLARALLNSFKIAYPRLASRYAIADSIDEAYAIIRQRRGSD